MTSIQKPVGKITLRDFKALFDRPGFYRYHFKTMDKEFGMVKEEVRDKEGTMREFLKCDQVKHPAILHWTGLDWRQEIIILKLFLFRSVRMTRHCRELRGRL